MATLDPVAEADAFANASGSASPWAPLRLPVFRMLWLAALASNLGSWMHLVAAGWLMTSLTTSAALVALLQSSSSLPSFALSLPAGALADVFDRRRLILVTQTVQLVIAGTLGAVTLAGAMTPSLLLALTAALGAAATLGLPAYAAISPDLVPPAQLPAAISLNSTAMTAAQAIGPAVGGLLVATLGAGAVFIVNAASFIAVVAAVSRWRPPYRPITLPPEHVGAAVRTGARYAANAPELQTVLVRCGAYVFAYSALPALLVLIARERLGGDAGAYGLLLGLLGVGGVAGALLLPRARLMVSTDALVAIATAAQVGVLLGVSLARSAWVAAPCLVVAGIAGMTILSSLNIAALQVLPGWVRGRGLAVFQLIFQLSFAGGAAAWGAIAATTSVPVALRSGAVALAITLLLVLRFRLAATDGLDVRPVRRLEPYAEVHVDDADGPVLVETDYVFAAGDVPALKRALVALRQARRREGAVGWAFYTDVERPEHHVETYVVASWAEHRRQAERRTVSDQEAVDTMEAFHAQPGAVARRHLLARRP